MSKQDKNEWEKEFVRRFVNNHGTHWRPLRGLWTEEVIEFIYEVISQREKEIAEEVEGRKSKPSYGAYTTQDAKVFWEGKDAAFDEILSILKH